jgi:DNA-directed RNA polymerase specialized sigma24 family protein
MPDENPLAALQAHRGRLIRAATRLVGNTAAAGDVVQDTYLRAIEGVSPAICVPPRPG